jgi:hypothetical protein
MEATTNNQGDNKMNTQRINYFTKLSQIEEIIGERTVFHGNCVVNCPNYELENGWLKLAGRTQRSYEGRFKMINGELWFASPKRKTFSCLTDVDEVSPCTYLESLVITMVGA